MPASRPPIGATRREDLTPEAARVYDTIAAGPRKDVPAPFLAMLDTPDLALAIQAVGSALRFSGVLPADLREIAILSTAAAFGSGYEWDYHVPIACAAGVPDAVIAAAAGQGEPGAGAAGLVIGLCRRAVTTREIATADLDALAAATSRAAASEVVAIIGYYQMLALFLAAARFDHSPG